MKFEFYQMPIRGLSLASLGQREWHWRVRAANGEIIASGEGYTSRENCLHGIALVMDTNRHTPVAETLS